MKKIKLTIKKILKNRRLVCLTANNIYTAEILDNICDIILVGDSLGMVVYGESTTSKVTLDMMINHGKAVRKGIKKSIMVVDMPKGTYEKSTAVSIKKEKKIKKITNSKSKIKFIPLKKVYGDGFEDCKQRIPSVKKLEKIIKYIPSTKLNTILKEIKE